MGARTRHRRRRSRSPSRSTQPGCWRPGRTEELTRWYERALEDPGALAPQERADALAGSASRSSTQRPPPRPVRRSPRRWRSIAKAATSVTRRECSTISAQSSSSRARRTGRSMVLSRRSRSRAPRRSRGTRALVAVRRRRSPRHRRIRASRRSSTPARSRFAANTDWATGRQRFTASATSHSTRRSFRRRPLLPRGARAELRSGRPASAGVLSRWSCVYRRAQGGRDAQPAAVDARRAGRARRRLPHARGRAQPLRADPRSPLSESDAYLAGSIQAAAEPDPLSAAAALLRT